MCGRMISTHVLQEWEGWVVEIREDNFVGRLVDVTAGSTHEEEEAEIPLAQISDRASTQLRLGSVFRWMVGYERSVSGAKNRVSKIEFLNIPPLTKKAWEESRAWARAALRSIEGCRSSESH